MGIEREDVLRTAELAGLDPEPEELERLERELDGILVHMELLDEVPLEGAEGGAGELRAPLRADEPGPDRLARPVRELAPDWCGGFFTVPRLTALGQDAACDEADGRREGGRAKG